MSNRTSYQTKQKRLVEECLSAHAGTFLSVTEVEALLSQSGETVGHTTVYRTLEALVSTGNATKVSGARGDAARYRKQSAEGVSQGQLSCMECGKAFSLDCSTWQDFACHVLDHHGFSIDKSCTALYGLCAECRSGDADAK